MFANNEVGTINPIREIGELAREKGILFHVDAVQAVGHVPIDVENMGIDMLSLSGHKFYAPKGVGALYIRNGVTIEKFLQGGAQERRRRAGTENVASIVGMGEAITLAMQEMPEETRRLGKLSAHMLSRLQKEIPRDTAQRACRRAIAGKCEYFAALCPIGSCALPSGSGGNRLLQRIGLHVRVGGSVACASSHGAFRAGGAKRPPVYHGPGDHPGGD